MMMRRRSPPLDWSTWATAWPSASAISAVIGAVFAVPRTPSVPKSRPCLPMIPPLAPARGRPRRRRRRRRRLRVDLEPHLDRSALFLPDPARAQREFDLAFRGAVQAAHIDRFGHHLGQPEHIAAGALEPNAGGIHLDRGQHEAGR